MKNYTKFILKAFTGCLLFVSYTLIAQINILPGPEVTPIDMVENIVGEGIMFDNVTFQGADASRGIFNNGETTNLGIGSGIFLTSGAGYVIPGPNTSVSAGANNSMPGHPSLNAITTFPTYDAAVLEFDFVPESDTLRFKYAFGSEEYNEWVTTMFNDVFGYFVTGPDPMGGFYNDKNIAIVPGTANTAVTINTINNGQWYFPTIPTGPCMNCDYYSDNTFGLTLEYDGFTTVLVAWLLVVPCETYHIKLGVADAGDHIYDTGVFIEENSFESPKIEVQTTPYPQGVSDNMIEGCVEADIIFKLPNPEYAPITIYFEVTGTANPAAFPPGDFEEAIPTSVTFEEDEDSVAIHVNPVYDGIIEGEETLILIIENTLGCIVRWDTVVFTIYDYVEMVSVTSPNTMICSGQAIEIWVNAYNGIPPYTFDWENIPDENDTITVSPDTTTTYFVDIIDLCLDTITDSIVVTVFPSPEINIGDSAVICEGDTLTLNAGGGYLSYLWQDGSTDSTFMVTASGLYYVHVVGAGGCATDDSIYVEAIILNFSLGADTTICIGDSIVFDPGGGYPSYLWQDGSTNQTFTAWATGTYYVTITKEGCTKTDSIYLYVDDPNVLMSLGNDTTICPGDYITLKPTVGVYNSYLWSTGDTTSSISVTQPGTYTLYVVSGCGVADDEITIGNWPEPDPNLGDDLNLCFGESALLEPTTSFSTYLWQDNTTLPFYSVTQAGVYWVDVTDVHGCEGSDTVYVDIAGIVDLGEDSLVLCEGETLTLDAGFGFDFYTWSTGEYGVQTIEVDSGGLYSVSVNYYFGCESEDEVFVTKYPIAEATITGENEMCDGESLLLEAPAGPFDYLWYLEETLISDETSVTVTEGGKYILVMSNVCGADSDEKTIELYPLPDVYLGKDVVLFPGENITLDAGNYQSYIWNDNSSLNDRYYTVAYDVNGEDSVLVWVEVFDGFCKNSDQVLIEMFEVGVPNVITPNGDGANDRFEPTKGWSGVNNHTMMVFNRWGEKVWESSDFPSGWDGKQNGRFVAEGTYFWVLEVYYGPDNVKRVYKGSLTVLGTGS